MYPRAQGLVGDGLAVAGGDEEDILHPFPQCGDLGRLHIDVELAEDATDAGQQPRPVRRDDFQHRHLPVRVRGHGGLGGHGERLYLARSAALLNPQVAAGVLHALAQVADDILQPVGILGDGIAVGVQHMKSVQGHAVAGAVHPGVVDAEFQLFQGRCNLRKQVVPGTDMNEYLRDAGAAKL